MSKIYKIGACVCIVLAVVIVLLEVFNTSDLDANKDNTISSNNEYSFQYHRPDFAEAFDYIEKLEKNIDAVDAASYKKDFEKFSEMLMDISTENRVLMIERYNNINSLELIDEYKYFFSEYEKLYVRYAEYLKTLIHSDVYSHISADWTEEERQNEVEALQVLDENYNAYMTKQEEIINEYYLERAEGYIWRDGKKMMLNALLESEEYSDDEKAAFELEALQNYYSQVKKLYISVIENNNNIAKYYGYNSYYDYYCTQNNYDFNSSIKPEMIYSWVKEELVPLYFSIYSGLSSTEVSDLLNRKYSLDETLNMLEEDIGKISPDIKEVFQQMLSSKHAWISNQDGKSTNNFTTYLYSYGYPFINVYLYENYIDQGSILHEFGHYYGYEKTGIEIENYMDVFETMAQSMNSMYWAMKYHEAGFSTDVKLNILNILQTTIFSALLDEFEAYAYKEKITDWSLLDQKYHELIEEYKLMENLGDVSGMGEWAGFSLILENPFYYRHYMMSSIPALMIMSEGFSSTDKMTNMYEGLISNNMATTIDDVVSLYNQSNTSIRELLNKITNMLKTALQN
ncbi:MAG: hypothetical protein IK014_03500 [Lachnospiraceae bacterium]|nr:hypothetical protein [Lachnospiraceae bacterium]